jgi:hypothetical protein
MVAMAVFAIGVAFAAQTVSERDEQAARLHARTVWVPGTNGVQAAYEASREPLAPPP